MSGTKPYRPNQPALQAEQQKMDDLWSEPMAPMQGGGNYNPISTGSLLDAFGLQGSAPVATQPIGQRTPSTYSRNPKGNQRQVSLTK